ncbi:MAG: F0F1 ATP synthase subunit A [Pirellulaceae bacterium]|nr:F0F1 ATP synthase subunit A [Pirellulaceae bacterium]
MANPVLHIKDSYYFEVPKVLCPSNFQSLSEFPAVWISLDPQFQQWEFDRLYDELIAVRDGGQPLSLPSKVHYREAWHAWVESDHANHGKPFDVFVEETLDAEVAAWQALTAKDKEFADVRFEEYISRKNSSELTHPELVPITRWLHEVRSRSAYQLGPDAWGQMKQRAGSVEEYKKEFTDGHVKEWSQAKRDAYNYHLSGKILSPQPFGGELRNLHEKEAGLTNVAISKFMIVEVVVGLILIAVFSWLARKVAHGAPPKGKIWNFLEAFVVFIRDQVAVPSIGHHHAHTYTPYLWTVFFFVLGCNLMGLIPWVGAPTGAFAVTSALALLTFGMVVAGGMREFGFFGFFKNIVPHMDLPWYIAIIIVPMLFVIEFIGLLVKHAVLAIRLLANMVAGHLVLLGLMAIAFSIEAVQQFAGNNITWSIAAVISVLACTAFSMMELFVAFLQAYVFTFLSALFIGSVLHKH